MTGFNPSRLRLARDRVGISRVQLSRDAGISERSLAGYEAGKHVPPSSTVDVLARELGVPSAFLYADELEALPAGAPSFRAVSKLRAGQERAALTSGALAIEVNRWLEARLRLPAASVPTYERGADDPVGAARRLRAEWGLGYAPLKNVVHLLEGRGVRVFSLPERLADVDAFSFWWEGAPYVVLNTRKSAERGRFDAAHELGHLVMHGDYDQPVGRDKERDANRFAAEFLMPADDVLSRGLRNAGVEQVLIAKRRWGVAAIALAYRLHELGATSDWLYASTCRRLSQMGYRSGEINGAPRETSRLLEQSFAALRQRKVTLADVARDMHVLPDTLRELMFGLALTAVDGGQQPSTRPRPNLRVV
ncbi:XRE family transcriptional regulator [Modestobacter sp. Leaf380]|uniref:XRE family transcriptional regulator n=1 Tax=Modestobacter sp. Leaf380 TaxID=1736356 RepID=UPI0009EA8F2D|nr:XRE family transcriptional regulator [Modestobacter sp. Leaf380]